MKNRMLCRTITCMASLAGLALLVPHLQAGPPLVCFPFQIGEAQSLPWGSVADRQNWNTPKRDYDTRRLTADTLSILADKTPVIVRMETMRRAAIYGRQNPGPVADLLAQLKARALKNAKIQVNALSLFDYGYMLETVKQARLIQSDRKAASAGDGDGYAYVLEALTLKGDDAEMEFAAAMIARSPLQKGYEEHFKKAVSGAAGDRLLAENLVSHFSDRGTTLTELRASADAPSGKR